MLALHDFSFHHSFKEMGFSRPGPSLLHIIHQTSPWVSVSHQSKQQQKQNKATLSDIQQIKTMSFLRKLDHSKKKKGFPRPFLQKKIPLKFQALTTHFVETNLQPRAPSFLMASSNPAEVPGTAARRTERKRSWMQLMSLSVFL